MKVMCIYLLSCSRSPVYMTTETSHSFRREIQPYRAINYVELQELRSFYNLEHRLALHHGMSPYGYRTQWTAQGSVFSAVCDKSLRQMYSKDVFCPSLGRVWMKRSKVKVTRVKNALYTPITPGSDGMNALAANNVTQQQTRLNRPFDRCQGWFWRAACGLYLVKQL